MGDIKKTAKNVLQGIGGVFVVLFVIALVFGPKDGSKAASASPSPSVSESVTPSESETPEPSPSGSSVEALPLKGADGQFTFTVGKFVCGVSKLGKDFLETKAKGQFCVVTMTVKNTGEEQRSFMADNQYLFDTQGRKYEADDDAGYALNDAFSVDLNPGLSAQVSAVFDVPKDFKPASIEVHDGAFSGGMMLALP